MTSFVAFIACHHIHMTNVGHHSSYKTTRISSLSHHSSFHFPATHNQVIMRIFTGLLIIAVTAAIVSGMNLQEEKRRINQIIADCKESTGASADDVLKLVMDEKPETREEKCMLACFLERMGVVSSNILDIKMNLFMF
jgi:hypothetical protein